MALMSAVCLMGAPFIGQHLTSIHAVLRPDMQEIESSVFWTLRMPRGLTAYLAGATLAVSGMVFQALFRNPLATESTLGVASGASFGAALQVRLGVTFSILGIPAVSVLAFAGAALSVVLVFVLSSIRRGLSSTSMLLAGVAISFFFSSLILMVQSASDFHNSYKLLRWLMGGLMGASYDTVSTLLPFSFIGLTCIAWLIRELDLLATGEDLAMSRGVEVRRVRTLLLLATSLAVGGVVSMCGPIGFVGMITPHICRLLVGWDHRYLMPASALMGGAFLVLCDTVARLVTAPAELPVGAITSLLGGPFMVWLLVARSRNGMVM